MTQLEIKQWLEWAVSVGLLKHLNSRNVWVDNAEEYEQARIIEGEIRIHPEFQVPLQAECEKRRWAFSIEQYEPDDAFEVNIYTQKYEPEKPSLGVSHSLVHAFMFAFKEAYEATK